MRLLSFLLLTLLLVSCATSPRDDTVCPQQQRAESSLNFVFVFHNLQDHSSEEYEHEMTAFLGTVAPFNKASYNVYTIELPTTLCWPRQDKTVVKSQLECDWTLLNKKIEACALHNAKVIILTGEDVQTVTVPTRYQTSFSVINERAFNRYAFLHEVGHLFGLQEEATTLRVYKSSPAYAPWRPNCATNSTEARDWWGGMIGQQDTGYYNGCAGHLDYLRPNNATLMGDKATNESGYGTVSTAYLQAAYDCCYAKNRTTYDCDNFFSTYPDLKQCR